MVTIYGLVCTRKGKVGVVVIKRPICIAFRMAGQACGCVIDIATDPVVLVVRFRVNMAIGTGDDRPHAWRGMTICTLGPYAIMFSAIDWKILFVVVEACRDPTVFVVTIPAVC